MTYIGWMKGQVKVKRDARDGRDEGPSKKGKGIAMDSSTSSGGDEDDSNSGEEVSGDESDDSNNRGNTGIEGGTYGVGGSKQGGVDTSWDSNYYATQDTDHGGRLGISNQRRHLDRLVDFSSDDHSSGHENYSWGYHNLEGHMQDLGLTSG